MPAPAPTLHDIEAAAARLAGQVTDTPCLESRTLGEILGPRIFLKFENLQFTASFKERGALNKLASLVEAGEPVRGVIAASAGNHAQGLAHHARRLGLRAVIVMPEHAPTVKVERTRSFGAEVILHGETFDEAHTHAVRLAAEQGLAFVHPFDDPLVVAGQGTVALEMLRAQPEIDTLVVAVGGGGLLAGMATAARALRPGIRIVGVQSTRFPAMVNALTGSAHPRASPSASPAP
jgi:threonine dehydratase